eukprot:2833454-Prymnesium_polylepis.1
MRGRGVGDDVEPRVSRTRHWRENPVPDSLLRVGDPRPGPTACHVLQHQPLAARRVPRLSPSFRLCSSTRRRRTSAPYELGLV